MRARAGNGKIERVEMIILWNMEVPRKIVIRNVSS